jgi:hypothetical protein
LVQCSEFQAKLVESFKSRTDSTFIRFLLFSFTAVEKSDNIVNVYAAALNASVLCLTFQGTLFFTFKHGLYRMKFDFNKVSDENSTRLFSSLSDKCFTRFTYTLPVSYYIPYWQLEKGSRS